MSKTGGKAKIREDWLLISPFIYMTGVILLFWLVFTLDLSTLDWAFGVGAIGFYFAIPIPLHDKILVIGAKLGLDSHKRAIRWSRLIRNYALLSGILFVIQPFLTMALGSQEVPRILELWTEFMATALLGASTVYLAKLYDLMEKLPAENK